MKGHVNSYDVNAMRPTPGSTWVWEPDAPTAREEVVVVKTEWNGEEWWVLTEPIGPGTAAWNSLGRFWEAVEPRG